MNIIDAPDWPIVTEEEFVEHLKQCPDYERSGYVGAVEYCYRHNNEHFATVTNSKAGEIIYLKP